MWWTLFACGPSEAVADEVTGAACKMPTTVEGLAAPLGSRPPLDLQQPARLEVATFALG